MAHSEDAMYNLMLLVTQMTMEVTRDNTAHIAQWDMLGASLEFTLNTASRMCAILRPTMAINIGTCD
jgi:hypothetical protein